MDDAGADVVLLVGVDAVEQLHAGAGQLGADHGRVHRLRPFEDLLRLLVRPKKKEPGAAVSAEFASLKKLGKTR